ncbi:glycosyltransferase family 4 protein [Salinibacter ruber]|uniref:glycosyltransferase family 4 protein n=1 Tax=Salinibacter ruber TaxID=146919 RepID=UPI002167FE9B|nr:glycosyltransferase family 4 protein [Salinibacter ruber]MCS4149364.1 glycosyltransferase involved in cell wall biosynthesis [Salinibacter ruber]
MNKIAYIIESPIQYHVSLFKSLNEREDMDVTAIYMSKRGVDPVYDEDKEVMVNWDIPVLEGYEHVFLETLPFHDDEKAGFWDRANYGVSKTLRDGDFDAAILHGYQYLTNVAAMYACKSAGIPVFMRGESEDFFYRSLRKKAARDAFVWVLEKILDAALYIGKENKKFYLNHGFSEDRLFHVPYCVDNKRFNPEKRDEVNIRGQFGIDDDEVLFVTASKHRRDRYVSDVIEAFSKLPDDQDGSLVLLGDGPVRAELESQAADSPRRDDIHFTGMIEQSEYPSYLAASDVLVHPSSETWGCAINEAISSGLAVLSSNEVRGWPDMVTPGVNGFVYPFRDTRALAGQMSHLVRHSEEVDSMGRESRRIAEELDFDLCGDNIKAAVEKYGR